MNDSSLQTPAPGQRTGRLVDGVRRFMAKESAGAAVLLGATLAALVWANSPAGATYEQFWSTPLNITLGGASLDLDLKHWVNDGLMVFFFFVLGLEVKRELVVGDLSDPRRAAVPIAAAAAGLAVPALVYLALNPSGAAAAAWGVVISTDTAFLLGVLALVGPRGSQQLRLFLLTLAVADDIGALTVIALFYTDHLEWGPLLLAAGGIAIMATLARLKIGRGPLYFVLGTAVWVATVASGVHPTIAGVVIALLTPAFIPRRLGVAAAARAVTTYRQDPGPRYARAARWSIDASIAPTDRLQLLYQPWSVFVIVPLFALANAGIVLDADVLASAATSPVTWGVVAGLVGGKLLGILGGTVAAVRLRLGDLAPGLDRWQIAGGAALSGIGFTISLLIVDLALRDDEVLADQARIGVLTASLVAALLGWSLFALGRRFGPAAHTTPSTLVPPVDPDRDHVHVHDGSRDTPLDAPGEPEATLVEFADFECPFCARATGSIDEVRAHYGSRLRYVFRHLPLVDDHPRALLAAQAAEAAGAQGKFWEMHDALFADQDHLSYDDLMDRVGTLGLNEQLFDEAFDAPATAARIRDDLASAQASGALGTPTFFINGQRWTGAIDARSLIAGINASIMAARREATADPDGDQGKTSPSTI
ncbi:Na+/H+ antiporter NhaA [Cryobacterium sp. PH29-G1]|uniref:Na+/H+ antiporter NhaA n=1 Tax=Cryobacterium sp. PH29-G1 TaxID=3046211 RepID=UPI0024BB20BC|nr:Na+/H+ antiporter NhaA [Cryobacterium sp. PH29-G1]MDJ0348476.1 Na+/H+ antiporter NhaA [Cryobacterium sp. PH29-G1]